MEVRSSRPRASLGRVAMAAAIAWVLASIAVAMLLAGALASANPGLPWGPLGVAMLWLAAVVNLAFAAFAALAAWILPHAFRPAPAVWGGVVALNLGWLLWNRLAMAHQVISVRPFTNTAGVIENLGVFAVIATVWLGVSALLSGRAVLRAALALLVAAGGTLLLLEMNRRGEADWNTYSLAEIREVAGTPPAATARAEASEPRRPSRILLLGIDGMSWNVVVPLWQAGELPNLRRLAAAGTVGVLDNGDESLSPRIWTTIYTGRSPAEHGIQDFQKLRLPGGEPVTDLLMLRPSLDTVYGLKHLVQRIPSLGLWSLSPMGSGDRREPTLWEVLARYDRRVAVVNPLGSLPLDPLPGGAIVDLRQPPASGPDAYQPQDLAKRWGRAPLPHGNEHASRVERMSEEISFALELFRDYDVDLGIYYTHALDTTAHMNWDFHSRGRFFIPGRADVIGERGWAAFVADRREDVVFDVYRDVDREIGRITDAFSDATILLVSDHGWTFFGYEHFGSPDGVLIGSGPGFEAGGVVRNASILDIAPTVLSTLGVPLSRELEGASLAEVPDVARVDRYERSQRDSSIDAKVSDEEIERLRAIGYVD